MSKNNDSLALLPNGFIDLLPPFAEREARSIRTLMDKFSAFGYRRIKPPLLEFEDSLLAPGPGERLAPETFRLMDPISQRMLGVRSDITAQVSRIVSSRLENESRPLRLTYANDVLRIRGTQMRTERQFTQVGCELVGDGEAIETDVEICVLALLGLNALGISDITLDFTIPGFVTRLLDHVRDDETRTKIEKAVAQRDADRLLALDTSEARLIAEVISVTGGAEEALKTLDGLLVDHDIHADIVRLKKVCANVKEALSELGVEDINLTVDLLEQDGFEYHKSLGFTLFSSHIRGELGRGGCYDVRFGQKEQNETAKGFTLYMDTISRFMPEPEQDNIVFVPAKAGWRVIQDLQEKGWRVLRGAGDNAPNGATHIYQDGTVSKL